MKKASASFFVFLGFSLIALAGMVWFSGVTGNAVAPFCNDTDNGINYTVKGTIYSLDRPYTDTCYNAHGAEAPSGEGVWEYYCQGTQMKKLHYRCKNFCIDGKCRTK